MALNPLRPKKPFPSPKTGQAARSDRQAGRLQYPRGKEPIARILGHDYVVQDISETGLKISYWRSDTPDVGFVVVGKILFHDQQEFPIKGRVIRVEAGAIAIALTLAVPVKKLLDDQRQILQEYSMTRAESEDS